MTLVTTDHSQSKRYWIIKADNEFDFDTDEPLYWCNIEGWVLLENCQRFSEEDAKKFPWAVDGGEWVKVHNSAMAKEECRYCGGDCPQSYMTGACDGYLGDIDGLYERRQG